jgi:hypothetical protein
MSALDDLIDTKIEADFTPPPEKSRTALPKGKARATLVEYGAARDVAGKDGQLWAIKPAVFLVEGTPYNDETGRPSLKIRYDVWVAMNDAGTSYDTGKFEEGHKAAGQDKNASMARFFKAFGRSTQGTSWNDLVGTDVTLGFAPEIDNRTDEPTGYLKGTWVGKAD